MVNREHQDRDDSLVDSQDSNPDPVTGQPGAHPVGTGLGAAGIGAVSTAVGAVLGGPVGAVVGAVVGSVAGGLVGKGVAESVNPTVEEEYWRENYNSRPYAKEDDNYENYAPAYRTGYEAYNRHAENPKAYEEVEPELKANYEQNYGTTGVGWDKAQHAARDAYIKLYEERLVASKHRDKVGEVGIGKHVETETTRVSVPVEKERVIVEKLPVDSSTPVAPGSANFAEGTVQRVELYEEVPEIRKEAFVREEVSVHKETDRETVEAEETLRREVLDVDANGQPIIDR